MKSNFLISFLIILNFVSHAQDSTIVSKEDTSITYTYSTIPEFWNEMEDLFDDQNFSNANWGVVIQSLETGEYFYKRNENKLFVPASNLKLFTTAGALIILGEEYRFITNIFADGSMDGSILEGNLVIQGRGDPTISGRFYDGEMLTVYKNWADSILNSGIDEINGNIVGDDNYFDDNGLGKGWSWNYESYWYAAQSSALSFNENCIDLYITRKKESNKFKLDFYPKTKYVVVKNEIDTTLTDGYGRFDFYREPGTNLITVYGTAGKKFDSLKTFVTVNNPTQFAIVILKDVLEKAGIKINGYAVDIDDLNDTISYFTLNHLFSHQSPELTEIIKVINKESHNLFAEQLLKVIGLEVEGYGTTENGIIALERIFADMGLNPENILMADGSGLSHLNLTTTKQIVQLLAYMYRSKHFTSFYNSFPIAGVDGTLGNRMKNTRAKGNVRAKTGYLNSVRSLSGYTYTGDNEPIAFSMIANNFNVPVKLAENLQDLVCLRLANFRRK